MDMNIKRTEKKKRDWREICKYKYDFTSHL